MASSKHRNMRTHIFDKKISTCRQFFGKEININIQQKTENEHLTNERGAFLAKMESFPAREGVSGYREISGENEEHFRRKVRGYPARDFPAKIEAFSGEK
jgi:hypothetical protein